MNDLEKLMAEAIEISHGIINVERRYGYEEFGDLSGLEFDYKDGEQLFLLKEWKPICVILYLGIAGYIAEWNIMAGIITW